MDLKNRVQEFLDSKQNIFQNIARSEFIKRSVDNREAFPAREGCLATWTGVESTGRSPKDTVFVKRKENENTIDWTSPNNLSISEETFDMLFEDALEFLGESENLYITDRVIGADSKYALPVKTVTNKSLTALFTDNMFRKIPENISESIFNNNGFTLLAVPDRKLDKNKYVNRLRTHIADKTSDMVVAVDFERRIGLVLGSAYMGSCKKMLFTVMNYYLPTEGILPLHCSANEGNNGDVALFLGLSGTGKTTLSADPERSLLGDDEHGWSEDGVANFENGCYAKMINIDAEKEPEIFDAVMHKDDYLNHGAMIENAFMLPNGDFDFDDERLTQNSRSSYPLEFLKNIKESSVAGHPNTIIFLTADAYGVLPPISKLDASQAMFWFLMGYTSKLAGTETGVVEPSPTFSRFFGAPFMPCNPDVYASMLGNMMEKHNTNVFLVNTGWIGGSYGTGSRIKLNYTRAMIKSALAGELENAEYVENKLFHLNIPKQIKDVPDEILIPENAWDNKDDYNKKANELAKYFSDYFDKVYLDKGLSEDIVKMCPGK